jgi:uncharacterized protein
VPTERTTVRRRAERGRYDAATIHAILDAALLCHVGFVVDDQPFVIPTLHGRDGDTVFIHGSAASRMLRTLRGGVDVCVTATVVDGVVLARSAFHHSMNYRSVVVLGRATEVTEVTVKVAALRTISEHVVPGRWDDVRAPDDMELRATTVLALPLREASAKVRTGPPIDDEADLELPVWAGVLPVALVGGEPLADDHSPDDARPYRGAPPWMSSTPRS